MTSGQLKPSKLPETPGSLMLVISPVVHFSTLDIDQDAEEAVKTEGSEVFDAVEVKLEESEDMKNGALELDDHIQSSDPEDDIPLKVIKSESERKIRRKKRVRVRREKPEDIKTTFKVDAHEIILSKEEQVASMIARSKTLNYILSPYKCELCYKGFVDTKAYENHKVKHDERSGSHSCEICRMRYRSAQLLRTHAVTAHSRLFKCNKCGHTTHTANQARVHEKWHSGFTYECQLCGHKFRKPTSYLSHMRKRHPTEHVCNVCGESFVGKHGLQMHKSKSHRNDVLVKETCEESEADRYCTECDIQFFTREAWKRHILCSVKHTLKNETSSECAICGWRGSSAALGVHLRAHARSLRPTRPAHAHDHHHDHCRCPQCGLNFMSRSKLQGHINRIHLGLKYNKNIVCEVCGKHCTSNATLKYHQRTHTGERPYSCTVCSKQFTDSNQLRIHTRTHTGEKPYECAVCGKRFSQKPALNRHYRVHTGDKPYGCQYCSRTFSQSNSLKLHVRTVHLKLPANSRKKLQEKGQEECEKNDQKLLVITQTQETVS
ncbi:unnamed protein product [Arctia plantaginis]|uniref:C2H2-type domain-containing protein n=1 Tax=Arctia plantaginis TaxID=874455 RepID=A0A8S1A7M4_ARCPL|nr:unnamed protein product [Arctia plantaginis]